MHVDIWTDGGARGNPGPAATGVVIKGEDGHDLFTAGYYLEPTTNNVAEYTAMIQALKAATHIKATSFTLHSDSQLIVRQLNGEYKVKHPEMKIRYQEIQSLLGHFNSSEFIHVRRELNKEADALVNQAMDCRGDVGIDAPLIETGTNHDAPANTQTPKATSETPPSLLNLKKLIKFSRSPKVIKVDANATTATGLICLDFNQSMNIPNQGKQTTCCILKGHGMLKSNSNASDLETGSWFMVEDNTEAIIKSTSDTQLIAIITQINDS